MSGEPWYPIPPDEPYPNYYSGDGDEPDEDEDGEADDSE